jgi:hypothetical protein
MPSKSQSARANGAKSHGPSTEAGRARSSQNALKHGFSAQTLVLPSEDPAEFQQLLTAYLDDFHPNGPAELDLVHQMVAAKWRLDRLAIVETQLFTNAIQREEELAADNDDGPLTAPESLTEAFRSLANSPYLTFLHRTESRLERSYSRALRNLLQLQRLRQPPAADPTPPENQICKNEPTAPAQPNGHLDQPAPNLSPISPPPPRTHDAHAAEPASRAPGWPLTSEIPPRHATQSRLPTASDSAAPAIA